ncbi:MAG: hypothetical protein AB7S26_31230 [Sandaracinaceae bacterium]
MATRSDGRAPGRGRGARLDPSEVPADLQGNFIVDYLVELTPKEEEAMERARELDEALGDGRPADD